LASCRIWDALGFKRIGRVKGCGNLKSYSYPVDAIIYGRELGLSDQDDSVTEERFDKIKYYLKHQKYPDGADRAEKSRLRSAATHYRLVIESTEGDGEPEEKLFLKDKEVISDPQKQYTIAREIHLANHGGINKTTASITEKYHWGRIKDTATLAIKNCAQCFDPVKNSVAVLGQNPPGVESEHGLEGKSVIPTESHNQSGVLPPSALSTADGQGTLAMHTQIQDPPRLDIGDSMDRTQYQVPVDPSLLSLSDYHDIIQHEGSTDLDGHGTVTEDMLFAPP
jgi:H2C2 zinc finger